MELLIYSKKHGNKVVYFDDIDYELINPYKWSLNKRGKTFYAIAKTGGRLHKKEFKMHRLIMNISDPLLLIDHVDHNGLNNCRDNLRIATKRQNLQNVPPSKSCKTGFKGVVFNKKANKYTARIFFNGKGIYLGLFTNPIEAAKKYNGMAEKLFGEFAYLNKIEENGIESKIITRSANIRRDNTSGYVGVYFNKRDNVYFSKISFNKKQIYIGRFDNPKEAAISYNKKALELYGIGAIINKL